MSRAPKKISLAVILLILIIWSVAFLFFAEHEPSIPLSNAPLLFDASRAYRLMSEFVTQNPSRVLGSLESRQSTGYLRDYLQELGYEIEYSHFEARIARKKQVGRNVLAFKKGKSEEILAVIAHFDSARTTVQGAMKNGAAVGVLLELARIFALSPTQKSLLLVFSDGGEWGSLGAQEIADRYPARPRIVAVLSLDYVASGDLAAFELGVTGRLRGFAPPWLRTVARAAAEAARLPVREPSLLREYFERAFLISRSDQGPFLSAGIAAINLGSRSTDPAKEAFIYHSAFDAPENLKIASLEKYGLTAERILRTLDQISTPARSSSDSLRLWNSRFLKSEALTVLHLFSFLPLPLMLCLYLSQNRSSLTPLLIGRELLAYAATLLPFIAVFFFIELFRFLRLIPLYSLYPPPAKDPVLENEPWGVLGSILAVFLLVAVVCYFVAKFSFRTLPKPGIESSRPVLLALLLVLVALALFYNSYWALAFLLLPSWIWPLCDPGDEVLAHIRNRFLILIACIPYCLALKLLASELVMSGSLIWYQILALANGLFSKSGYLLWAASAALGIRFFVIQGSKPELRN